MYTIMAIIYNNIKMVRHILSMVSIQLNILVTCPIRIQRNAYETMLFHRVYNFPFSVFVITLLISSGLLRLCQLWVGI